MGAGFELLSDVPSEREILTREHPPSSLLVSIVPGGTVVYPPPLLAISTLSSMGYALGVPQWGHSVAGVLLLAARTLVP